MMMSEIITKVKSLAENDQSIPNTDITSWVDDAIQRINIALQCNIPTTSGNTTTLVPSFDVRYHEALVLFCVGRYRESDSDYNGAMYFNNKFEDMLKVMQRDMVLQPSVRTDYNVQQIVVTNATVLVYTLTIPYGSYFDMISVYKNDVIVDPKYYTFSIDARTITFKGITLAVSDKITIQFENNSDLNNPPYAWWSF